MLGNLIKHFLFKEKVFPENNDKIGTLSQLSKPYLSGNQGIVKEKNF